MLKVDNFFGLLQAWNWRLDHRLVLPYWIHFEHHSIFNFCHPFNDNQLQWRQRNYEKLRARVHWKLWRSPRSHSRRICYCCPDYDSFRMDGLLPYQRVNKPRPHPRETNDDLHGSHYRVGIVELLVIYLERGHLSNCIWSHLRISFCCPLFPIRIVQRRTRARLQCAISCHWCKSLKWRSWEVVMLLRILILKYFYMSFTIYLKFMFWCSQNLVWRLVPAFTAIILFLLHFTNLLCFFIHVWILFEKL